jgi:hypothetical protein
MYTGGPDMKKPDICPTCKQTIPRPGSKRICAHCKSPIRLHDKYYYLTDPHGSYIVHKDCANPTAFPAVKRPDPKQARLI